MTMKLPLALAIGALFTSFTQAADFKVGCMSGPESQLCETAVKVAKDKYHLDAEVVQFDDYVTPNIALHDKDIDVNAFQHKPYLDTMNKDRGLDLVPVGNTFVYPIGGYSKKYKSLIEIPDGAKIAIPNDPSNEGRTLILLDKHGLIKLADNTNLTASLLDIKENPHHYQFVEVDAAQLPRMLDEVALAFINSTFAVPAGLNPSKDPLIVEDKESPYVNVIAAREDNKDSKAVKDFVAAYESPEVEAVALKAFKGGAVKGW